MLCAAARDSEEYLNWDATLVANAARFRLEASTIGGYSSKSASFSFQAIPHKVAQKWEYIVHFSREPHEADVHTCVCVCHANAIHGTAC